MARIHGKPELGADALIYSQPSPSGDGTTWAPFEGKAEIDTVKRALNLLETRIAPMDSVNAYFRGLPGTRTFQVVLDDPRIWISRDPHGPAAAETVGLHITLGLQTLRIGFWAAAATLLHEMAHVNGATDIDGQAEKALLHAGLQQHYVRTNSVPRPRP
jgi:hypothetical protein